MKARLLPRGLRWTCVCCDTTYICTYITCAGAVCCCCTHQGVTAPGKGNEQIRLFCGSGDCATHPVGKCAEFEIKSSAACCLMYSGLWCVCAQLRGWVGWRGEFRLLFQVSSDAQTPEPTDQSCSTKVVGKYIRSPWATGGYSADTSRMPCPSKDCRHEH